MTPFAFINTQAGGVDDLSALRDRLLKRGWNVRLSTPSGDAGRAVVEDAKSNGADCVVAVGGDGTINQIVNELMAGESPLPLGILPLGTGNDLARTLHLPFDLDAAIETVEAGRTVAIDLFRMEAASASRYGVNVSAGGFAGVVDEALSAELKAQWGPLAYLVGAAKALAQLEDYETQVSFDDAPPEAMQVLNVVVANGRTAAGGHVVAPDADPCDGRLDVVIVRHGSAPELVEVGARLMAGSYLESPLVEHRRVRSVRVASNHDMRFNIDGEPAARDPVQFQVLPGALPVIVGSDVRA